jgi:hypothetical protein
MGLMKEQRIECAGMCAFQMAMQVLGMYVSEIRGINPYHKVSKEGFSASDFNSSDVFKCPSSFITV